MSETTTMPEGPFIVKVSYGMYWTYYIFGRGYPLPISSGSPGSVGRSYTVSFSGGYDVPWLSHGAEKIALTAWDQI
jgi:hypothetical protein